MNKDEIIAGIRAVKAERTEAAAARDALKERMERVRTLVLSLGDAPTLTKLLTFLRTLREILSEAM